MSKIEFGLAIRCFNKFPLTGGMLVEYKHRTIYNRVRKYAQTKSGNRSRMQTTLFQRHLLHFMARVWTESDFYGSLAVADGTKFQNEYSERKF